MGIDVLQTMGLEDQDILGAEQIYREQDQLRLDAQGEAGNLRAGPPPLYVPPIKKATA
jgi:hypothetical protein